MPSTSYRNVTLDNGVLSATVFLPGDYYASTRFDWSSMVGDVRLGNRTFFGSGSWRQPHDPAWTESGVGLASEFGCGADGAVCGGASWAFDRDEETGEDFPIANGVLGHDGGVGAPFLKIGVGALVVGSCADCGVNDTTYKFNSPYRFFASPPAWEEDVTATGVTLRSSASLGAHGYALEKSYAIVALGGAGRYGVEATTTLRNSGASRFRTPHYCHNFLTFDGAGVGPGYRVRLPLASDAYDEPGNGTWAAPLGAIGNVRIRRADVLVDVRERLGPSTKVKVTFARDDAAGASYVASGDVPGADDRAWVAASRDGPRPLYDYALYLEAETLSPEPVSLIDLAPGEKATWTEAWAFGTGPEPVVVVGALSPPPALLGAAGDLRGPAAFAAAVAALLALVWVGRRGVFAWAFAPTPLGSPPPQGPPRRGAT